MQPDFIEIDNILVSTDISETPFTCDLAKCKGACCTMESKYGAPLKKEEIEIINKNLPIIKEYLSKEHQKEIEKNGFWMQIHGEYMTKSIDNRACVFVSWENDIAKCSIEKAYSDGKIDFIKPASCHLFPIRVGQFGGKVLRYEKYIECEPALKLGEKIKTNILNFCKDALQREFGKEWFTKIKDIMRV
ncbi:DUF3109 family protein [Melioribacteraceae bacterium 4301-Me]|uniref:DUF3109 family protein n=1 Tax=Pyranulibacter aquaticus TaxID=3163344 RepID=UPI0035955406